MNMMEIKWYVKQEPIYAGISLKSVHDIREMNNMALHACKDEQTIVSNRQRLASSIGQPLERFVCANQAHSANVWKVTKTDIGSGAFSTKDAIPNSDALYTTEKDVVLCTFTADCVPVFFYNKQATIVGVIHSGWKGTVQEITLKTFQHINDTDQCQMTEMKVHLGMGLSEARFEVDEDVATKYKQLGYADPFIRFNERTGKFHIDNQLVVKEQCKRAGILEQHITIDRTCTYDSEYGFSYREQKDTGRHLGFIFQRK